ncbi:MAG: hypothetical protein ACREA2_02605 [Blastocatellia bacterium]
MAKQADNKRHAGGRPSKLTPAMSRRIILGVSLGLSYQRTCDLAQIPYRTVRRWILRGEQEQAGKFWRFCQAIKKAEAAGVIVCLTRIHKAAEDDWRAAAWFLERRFPEAWARRRRNIHANPDGSAVAGRLSEHMTKVYGGAAPTPRDLRQLIAGSCLSSP